MITRKNIESARQRIAPLLLRTPLIRSKWLSEVCDGTVYLKLESEQYTGSFKARGSLNKLMWLQKQGIKALPVTASSGNHGLGFAHALEQLGIEGTVFVPESIASSKLKKLQQYGVEIKQHGSNYDEMEAYVLQYVENNEVCYVSPYNDKQVIAGQGTIAAEIVDQLSSPDYMLATVGGGGLISGIGTYMNEVSPQTKIIGCQPENSPEMSAAVQNGSYKNIQSKPTLSDGSAGGFEESSITLPLCKKLVDDFILITENEIKQAIRGMITYHGKLIEGAAGVAIASLLKQPKRFANQTTVIVVCGANISPRQLQHVLDR